MFSIICVVFIINSILLIEGQNSIQWSGYQWFIRDQKASGPGPNDWDPTNVWLDGNGRLHLKLRRSPITNRWTCAELYTKEKFTFGTFRWFVEGPLDRFDPNVVLGLFTYGGPDGTNEIDIEVARWSQTDPKASNIFYTTYPDRLDRGKSDSIGKLVSLQGTYTTHQFTWRPTHIDFQSRHGFTDVPDQNVMFSYQTPSTFRPSMPINSAPLHMNLWAFKGRAPLNGEEVEIILHDFPLHQSINKIFII